MNSIQRLNRWLNRESVAGVVFSLPFIIGFLLFLAVPMGLSLIYSFSDYDILSPARFAGFSNYIRIFTHDQTFISSVKATFYFALVSVPLRLVFALIVALILVRPTKAVGFYRAAYYLLSIIGGSVAISVLWRRMFAVDGVVNSLLGLIGIPSNLPWLSNTRTAIWTLIILAVWQFADFSRFVETDSGFFVRSGGNRRRVRMADIF